MIILISISILLTTLVVISWVLYKYKVFASFQVRRLTIPKATLTFVPYVGDYHAMVPTINMIKDDLQRFIGGPSQTHPSHAMIGVYYDNPRNLIDKNQGRAILGIINAPTNFATSTKNQLKYQTAKHGDLTAIGATFPLTGLLSLMSAIFRGYPAIVKQGMQEGLIPKMDDQAAPERSINMGYSMEIYEWGKQKLTISFPYGDEAKSLYGLSGASQPAYKHPVPAKKEL